MSDPASLKTDKEIKKLEKKIKDIYSEAQKDIEKKLQEHNKKFAIKDAKLLDQLNKNEISPKDYSNWLDGQIFQGEQWDAKKDQIINTIQHANGIATNMVNGQMANVFAFNGNYAAYDVEHGAGINFGFGLYDSSTVTNLIKNNPQILPKWKINEEKDYKWNAKKVNNAITQGIIQGERLDQVTKRLSEGLCAQNENLMKTFARTGMTEAQNAGRYYRQIEAKQKGLDIYKEWMATLDDHTRDTHAEIDGEKIKVADIWHPMKFSNGCRYPGDPLGPPSEVYNCRCTLVSDVEGYPAEYERYDNIDGHPIKNMTYEEWHKAKELEKEPIPQPITDYDKYGGKEVYDVLSKYNDYDDFLTNSNLDDYGKVMDQYGDVVGKQLENTINQAISEVKNEEAKIAEEKQKLKEKEEENKKKEQEAALKKAEEHVSDLEKEIADKGADKKFEGIWYNQTVTYADYEDKKDSIEAKKEYYKDKIQMNKDSIDNDLFGGEKGTTQIFLDHDSLTDMLEDEDAMQKLADTLGMDEDDVKDAWMAVYGHEEGVIDKSSDFDVYNMQKFENKIAELEEFEKNGEEYSKLLEELKEAKQEVKDLTPKQEVKITFGDEAYTQERKDNAVWAKSPEEADGYFRQTTKDVWATASKDEKYAAWDYTAGSGKFNRPLRGYDGSWYNNKGVGDVPLNREGAESEIIALTDLLKRSEIRQDTWLTRGVETLDGLSNFVKVPEDVLRRSTQEELEQLLLGKEISDEAFMSCGSAKGTGFPGSILNIYCPKGTQGLYVEPFSEYGRGDGKNWDGKSDQKYFGLELETLLQRNTHFVVTKVEKKGSKIFVDVDVTGQYPDAISYN